MVGGFLKVIKSYLYLIYIQAIFIRAILKKFNLYNLKLITMANTHEIEGLGLQEAKNIQEKLETIER